MTSDVVIVDVVVFVFSADDDDAASDDVAADNVDVQTATGDSLLVVVLTPEFRVGPFKLSRKAIKVR